MKEDTLGQTFGIHDVNGKCIQNFSWETSRKRLLGISRRRWKDNIKMDLRGTLCGFSCLRMRSSIGIL